MARSTYPKRFVVLGHQRVSRYEPEDMRVYARLATALMTAESEKHTVHVDSVVNRMSEAEHEAYFEANYDTHELVLRRFPNQQQQSFVVLTYTVVETRLVAIARALLRSSHPELTLRDLPLYNAVGRSSRLGAIFPSTSATRITSEPEKHFGQQLKKCPLC